MTEDVKPEKIKKAQETLSQYIKKPPLTEKLLKKPPFRFLHDIVTSVMKESEILDGVFSPEELLSENIKDRDGKITFLEKLISNIKSITGSSVSAKPSKIVAGLEVNKTLDLLILLAKALEIKKKNVGISDKKSTPRNNENEKKRIPRSQEGKEAAKSLAQENGSEKGEKKKLVKSKSKPDSREINGNTAVKDEVKKEIQKENDKTAEPEGEIPGGPPPVLNSNERRKSVSNAAMEESNERRKSVSNATVEESNGFESGNEVKVNSRRSSTQFNDPVNIVSQSPAKEFKEVLQPLMNGDVTPPQTIPIENNTGHVEPVRNEKGREKKKKDDKVMTNGEKESDETAEQEKKERIQSGGKEDTEKSSAKMKRPQSARVRPGSSRHRRVVEEKTNSMERNSFDSSPSVMGRNSVDGADSGIAASSPVSIPSAKGGRPMTGWRPPSARPGAPRPRDRGEVKVEPEPVTSNDTKPITLIEDKKDMEDDSENLVVVEKQIVKPDFEQDLDSGIELQNEDVNQGALVSQILETKKELEENKLNQWSSLQRPNVEIEWEKSRKAKREAWGREVDRLRDGIQNVTRASNPLGKLFDFLQEDVELMQRELESWSSLNKQLQTDLTHQQRITEDSLGHLKKQLEDMNIQIENEQEAIRRVKANIFMNNSKIDNLLKMNSP